MKKVRLAFSYFLIFCKRKIFSAQFLATLRKNRTKIIAAIVVILIILGAVWYFKESLTKKYVSEAVVGTYTDKDIPEIITKLLSTGLVKLDQTGQPFADLAAGWEVNKNDSVYTFKLKPNQTWADGSPVLSKDILFNLQNTQVNYPDDQTIQFQLSDPYSPFPTLLTTPIFKGDSYIGMGPYFVHEIQKDHNIVRKLVLYSKDTAKPDLVVNFYANEHQATEALKLGQVESILGVSDLSDVGSQKNLKVIYKNNYTQLVTIFYDTSDKVLSDDNLRLALSYGAPTIPGETEAETSLPESSWAFNPDVKNYLDNAEQAKISLKKVKTLPDQPIILTATTNLAQVGEQVVEAWQKLGIKAQLRVESGIPQNFQALLITHTIPIDPDQYSLWHSTQTQTNLSKISNPRIDKDLEDGRVATDSAIRKQKYQDFQKILLDNAPATFLYFPKYNVVYTKKAEKDLQSLFDIQLSGF